MSLIVPTQNVPNQVLNVQLANQACTIAIYQKGAYLFLDLSVANVLIVAGVLCENLNRIVRSAYLGFIGDLTFLDNEGSNDPDYTGLGPDGRFNLIYLEETDLEVLEGS